MITKSLDWPSLTVQWLPSKDIPSESEFSVQKLILGTHTSDQEPNFLIIAKVRLPIPIEQGSNEEEKSHYKSLQEKKIEFEIQIPHEGEINKARYCPQEPQLIATKTISGEVHLFNYFKHPSKPTDNKSRPDARLIGHTKEGYGLSWNPNKKGYLLSSSNDHLICLWDITTSPQSGGQLPPLSSFIIHQNIVEDVCWHKFHPSIFGSVDDDKKLAIWDIRNNKPMCIKEAHSSEIRSIDFNPLNEYLLSTGSTDGVVKIWDIRNIKNSISTLDCNHEEINAVQWAPFDSSIIAATTSNKLLYVWGINKMGKTDKQNEVSSELFFLHGGHTANISDFAWNPSDHLTIASVDDDNMLQIWQMESEIYLNAHKAAQ